MMAEGHTTASPPAGLKAAAERLCVGVVTGAKGLQGEVRIKSFTDRPQDLTAYGPLTDESGARIFSGLHIVAVLKGQVIARMDGVNDRTAAEGLKKTRLHVLRAALPVVETDEFYEADLVGLGVEGVSGEALGTVRGVDDFGAGPVLAVDLADGGELLVPFTQARVPKIDPAGGRVVIDPLPIGDDDGRGDGHGDGK